ncbi:MAG: hypothetical protein MJ168_10585 [Clostridia bacterium]|nr:hypothetical protein [Clostridia bacterium]
MNKSLTANNSFNKAEIIIYSLLGALLGGAMWRARGSHGWGSEMGVITVGLLVLVFIYAVFKRRTNASFFQIVAAASACALTTPAWGTLLNQTSGYFEVSVKGDYDNVVNTFNCTPWSGVFIMLCLGFGMMPLFMFAVSRLFSDKKYSLVKYIAVVAVFFAVFYIANATVSHLILKLVQPESIKAFEWGLDYREIKGSAYSVYMKHFSDINWGKKVPFGRNYFTEITVISHAIAAAVTALFIRIGFKDKVGAKITFWGCAAFSVGITVANVFFVLKNKLGVEAHPWLDGAWSFWEFSTGFISVLLVMLLLFSINKKYPDIGFKDNLVPKLPEKVQDIILCLFVFCFGFGWVTIAPLAERLDASDVFPIIVYAVGGAAIVVLAVLMLIGKLPKVYKDEPVKIASKMIPVLFGIHMLYYHFVGYTQECPPYISIIDAVEVVMIITTILFFAGYLTIKKKELFVKK